ncbi:MAG: right-handed parallel beta-helix repeat-containing protein [Gemmataceae bacterium]
MAVEWLTQVLARFTWSSRTVGRGRRRVTLRRWVPWPNLDRLLTARLRFEHLEDRVTPATVTWDGGAGTLNWEDALNWDTNALPTAADDVVIPDLPAPGSTFVDLYSGQAVKSLTVSGTDVYTNQGANLSLNPGASLTVTNGVSVTHGDFRVFDAAVSATTITLNTGGFLDGAKATVTAAVANVSGGLSWGDGGYGLTGFPLTIAGTYTQGAAGNFYVVSDAVANSAGGVVSVTGTASLDGFIVLNPLDNDPLDITQGFTVLQAGAVSGGFAFTSWYGSGYGSWSLAAPFKTSQTATDVTLTGTVRVVTSAADAGAGSLRQAILDANASGQPSLIGFRNTVGTITPASALPSLTVPVEINATQLFGYAGTPLVELRGDAAGSGKSGLQLSGAGSIVRGLAINRFNGFAVRVFGNSAVIAGNRIGTNPAGDTAVGGGGIQVFAGSGTVIGGPNPTDRNLISTGTGVGNGVSVDSATSNTTVRGNYIGTDAAGTAALGNFIGVLVAGPNAVVRDNVIAAGSSHGLSISGIDATGAVVLGNRIGLGADGSTALGNGGSGVVVSGGADTATVGDGTAGGRNVISANAGDGITLSGSAADNNLVRGNYIGTDATGLLARGNTGAGVRVAGGGDDNQIGGFTAVPGTGAGNVIAGNGEHGVAVEVDGTDGTRVWGNLIGLGADGSTVLGNAKSGVYLAGAANTQIGGDDAADGATDGAVQARNVISGNTRHGVEVVGYGATRAMTNTIAGNYIGTDRAGAADKGNLLYGVGFVDRASNNAIGGTTAGAGNVISGNDGGGVLFNGGNVFNNIVAGNLIGTAANGTDVLGNTGSGVTIQAGSVSNTIGGTTVAARNVISGNTGNGVSLSGAGTSGNRIAGNYIGVDAGGNSALANGVDGVGAGTGAAGNVIGTDGDGSGDVGEGNVISGNAVDGVAIGGAGADSNVVAGNLIGLGADGTTPLGNGVNNVLVFNGALGTRIGTNADGESDAAERNVISSAKTQWGILVLGSGTNLTRVAGNYIGTDRSGTIARGNAFDGIGILDGSASTTVGGLTASERNVISGNLILGIHIQGSASNTVQGNYIGTKADGSSALGNASDGVYISGAATGNTIGGSAAAARNIISGNGFNGVEVSGSGTSGNAILGNYIGTDFSALAPVLTDTATANVLWLRGEAGGIDSSAQGNTGTLTGGVTTTAGKVGRAFDFPGNVGDYIRVPDSPALSPTGAVSVELWVKGTAPAGLSYLLAKGPAGAGNAAYALYSLTGGLQFYVYTAASGLVLSPDAGAGVWDNTWHHVVGVYDGSRVRLYVDGVQVGTGTPATGAISYSLTANTPDLFVGNYPLVPGVYPSGDLPFKGQLDEVGVFNRALTGAEVAAIVAQGGRGVAVANSVGVQIANGATGNTVGGAIDGAGNVISGNTNQGVRITADSNKVQGNVIGLNAAGTLKLANNRGVELGASSNLIGTDGDGASDSKERNVISGNATYGVILIGGGNNRIAGNYIGTKADGTGGAVGNGSDAIFLQSTSGNVIGTDGSNDAFNASEKNLISGNGGRGVVLAGANVVAGNWIGVDVTGAALGNDYGIQITGTGSRVGTNADGVADTEERNVISGSTNAGIIIRNASTTGAVVAGNYIGTDPTGSLARPNDVGIAIVLGANANTVGGTAAGAGNVISGNTGYGIQITDLTSTGNTVAGNLIGTNGAGKAAVANANGVLITAPNNIIGGATAASRNVISGNTGYGVVTSGTAATGNVIRNNYIGTDTDGKSALGNGVGASIQDGANTLRDNLISGNSGAAGHGVYVSGPAAGTVIAGNSIGLAVDGTTALPNAGDGINILASPGILVGGTTTADRNIISGNTGYGVLVSGTGADGNIIRGNYIGLAADGTTSQGNKQDGILIQAGAANTVVGGTAAGAGNVIAANRYGVQLNAVSGGTIQGNYIGLAADGDTARGNTLGGVVFSAGANSVTIGGMTGTVGPLGVAGFAGNLISGNTGDGVGLVGGGTGSTIQGNVIGTDVTGTKDRGNTGHGVFLGSASDVVVGALTATPGTAGGNLIGGNDGDGVRVTATGGGANHLIRGNLIGTNAAGTGAVGNAGAGVAITFGDGITIGGSAAGAGNVISGNAGEGVQITGTGTTGNVVQGNYIGTKASGLSALGNTGAGVYVFGGATNTVIGGTTPAARNVISGSAGANGVAVSDAGTDGTVIQGNYIGTDKDGTAAVPNFFPGVAVINGATNTRIGGLTATPGTGAGNVISGNKQHGVMVRGGGTAGTVVQGNLVGLAAGGTAKLGNGTTGSYGGVVVFNGAADTTIGGTDPLARNVISGNENLGVGLLGAAGQVVTGTVIQGNYIGTDITGATPVGNGLTGVGVLDLVADTTVGGTAAGAGNLISGNAGAGVLVSNYFGGGAPTGTAVQGNRIGTDQAGTAALPNTFFSARLDGSGVILEKVANTAVGGTAGGAGNLVSGNAGHGVRLTGAGTTGNTIAGNFIGTNAAGTAGLGNGDAGVYLAPGASNNTIGGAAAAARNVVSGNAGRGVYFFGAGTGNLAENNLVGLAADGESPLGNVSDGVRVDSSPGVTIRGNVIAANLLGVSVIGAASTGTVIAGNRIGTDDDGENKVGSQGTGVILNSGATGVVIGGPTPADRNLISGNVGAGVQITGVATTGNTVLGNFIGTNAGGSAAVPNARGVSIFGGASGNTVGGTTAAARNVISGNTVQGVVLNDPGTSNNVVQGNYIGTDWTGTVGLSNLANGVVIRGGASANTIGGTTPGAGNLISGNNRGVHILEPGTSGNLVQGNLIGLDATGKVARSNETQGVVVGQGATDNTIGGTVAGAGNVISGNAGAGVMFDGVGTTGNRVVGNRVGLDQVGQNGVANGTGVLVTGGAGNNTVGTAEYGQAVLTTDTYNALFSVVVAPNGATYVVDYTTGPGSGLIYRIDLATGARTLLSSGGLLTAAATAAVESDGNLIVPAGGSPTIRLVRVNTLTGAQTLVSDSANPSQGPAIQGGAGVAVEPTGNYLVTSWLDGSVFRVDRTTGVRTLLTTGNLLTRPNGIVVLPDGTALVADDAGRVVRVDRGSGVQSLLVGGLVAVLDLSVAADGFVLATESLSAGQSRVLRIDPSTGAFSVLASGGLLRDAVGIAAEPGGTALVADLLAGSPGGRLVRLTPEAARNEIAFNTGDGVWINGATTAGNTVTRNRLYANGPAASPSNLRLSGGANAGTPAAVISGVLAGPVSSQLLGRVTQAAPNSTYRLEVFYTPNDAPETRQFQTEAEFTTDAAGAALIDLPLGVVFAQGGYVTTTLTRVGTGDTGPISAAAPLGLVVIDGQPAAGVEGTPITLTTRAIDPGPGQRVGYAWRVTKNGAEFAAGNEAVFTYTPDDNGAYVVSLTVTTTAGLRQDVPLSPLAVSNLNPVAELVAAPTADVPTGSSFTVQARLRDQGAADLGSLLYTWAVNGAPVAGPFPLILTPALSYTPAAAGPYTVTLAVTDKDGGTNTLRYTVTAAGALPAAVIAVLSQGQEGTTVHARADLTAVRNQDDLTFAWQAVKNGVLYAAVTGKARPNFEFIPDDNGTYVVTLRVTGPGTDVTAPPRAVTVANIAPQPAIGYAGPAPTSFPAGVSISYQASVTDPGTADTQTYLWQVTDALTGQSVATASGQSFPFTPSAAGTYLVRLTATDDDAGAGVTMTELVVTAAPRAVAITGPTTGTEGGPLTFGSSITPPAGGVGFRYFWEARRNDQLVASASSPAFTTTPLGFTFIPPDNGTYVVSLRVVGADQSGATTSQAVTVANVPPTVTLTPSAGPYREGSPVTFTATAADPAGTNDPISYRWLVNGVVQPNQAGPTFTFTPPDNGPFQVQVQTKDDDMPAFGAAPPSAASVTLSVQNVAPSVAVGPATDADGALLPGVPAGFAYNLTAGATDPANPPGGPVNDPLGYTWTATVYPAGGGAGAPLNPAFYAASPDGRFFSFNANPAQPGTYVVTVSVSDGDGGVTAQTTSFKFGTANADVITVTAADLVGGATRVAVFALGGNDTVSAAGVTFPVVLDGGAGNDTLTGGSADDLILGGAGTDCLVGGAGNDTVVTQHGNDSVYTGTGDDSVVGNLGSDLFLSEADGGGQDTIDLSGTASPLALDLRLNDGVMRTADAAGNRLGFVGQFEAVKGSQLGDRVTMAGGMALFGGAGADDVTVPTGVSAVTLFGGDGNDLAHVAGGTTVTVVGGAGNDAIDLTAGSNITVFGGDGVDTVAAAGATQATVFGGAGADDLAVTAGSQITVFGGSDDDILRVLGGSNVTVFGGDGDLPAGTTDAALVTQFGGSGNDQITVDGNPSLVTVFGGDGNDIVDLKTGSLVTVFGDAGDDAITLEATVGSNITVFGGDGVDAVSVLGGTQVTVFGDAGDDAVAVTGGSLITVFGGDGVDRLDVLGGSQVTVFGGLEADALTVGGTATLVTVFGGDGNDLVTVSAATGNVTVFGDAGADKIDVTAGSNVTVFGGADDDFVTLRPAVGADVTVFGGDGNDLVDVRGGTRVTVFGGAAPTPSPSARRPAPTSPCSAGTGWTPLTYSAAPGDGVRRGRGRRRHRRGRVAGDGVRRRRGRRRHHRRRGRLGRHRVRRRRPGQDRRPGRDRRDGVRGRRERHRLGGCRDQRDRVRAGRRRRPVGVRRNGRDRVRRGRGGRDRCDRRVAGDGVRRSGQ